jgi:cyclopropane fatty-acyl-phospholipid synthase-like methyltransferase
MSTYVLMRILESAPRRYEMGIRLLTLGRLDRAYDRLASNVGEGRRVLDVGCGTGALTLRAARNGARVKGIDVNTEMMEVAESRVREAGLSEQVELQEMGVAELDGEEPQSYDAVMSGLCFSELSEDELTYTLGQVGRILRPGGLLIAGDEVRPSKFASRLIHSVIKAPLAVITYLIAGQTTHAIEDLPARVTGAGLSIVSIRTTVLGSFMELVARKPAEAIR